ncbi:cytochrome P450 11C1 [Aulostomus maculatus]
MESVVRVKKSLRRPIRRLSSCVLGVKERKLCAKHRNKRSRGGGGRGRCNRLGKTPPLGVGHTRDASVIRSYQADLEKERQLRETMNAQKNAERAAMRAHFRKKYQLSESPKDTNHLRSVNGKVSLPRGLSKIIHPENKSKDDGFDLLSAFQGLTFGTPTPMGKKHTKMLTPAGRHSSGAVVNGRVEGRESTGVRKRGVDGRARSFEEIPHTGRNGWLNLVKFWREGNFQQLHKYMEKSFKTLGPIYREHLGLQRSVNIMMPCDISQMFISEGLLPRRMLLRPWEKHREIRKHSKGVFLKNGEEWRADRLLLNKEVMMTSAVKRFIPLLDEVARDFCQMLGDRVEREGRGMNGKRRLTIDPSPDLFRFALEGSGHVLYGERIGLFSSHPSVESEKFIVAVERMLTTTPPLLYLPLSLLVHLRTSLWTQHATAWDHIFSHAEARIYKGYQRLSPTKQGSEGGAAGGRYPGLLGQLMEKGQLSSDRIKANITELMAGAVETTAVPLQFALFELGRNPEVQEKVRKQVRESWEQAGGDPQTALQGAPLLKSTIKEILRLYPVGITLQRYPVKDIVLQNYNIPAGTMVQACLYPLGRSAEVFKDPQTFDPCRWERTHAGEDVREGMTFRSLAFGFGARQCIGRRIAENEMQLLLMHILLSFHLSVTSSEDISTKYTIILQPETPPKITFSKL